MLNRVLAGRLLPSQKGKLQCWIIEQHIPCIQFVWWFPHYDFMPDLAIFGVLNGRIWFNVGRVHQQLPMSWNNRLRRFKHALNKAGVIQKRVSAVNLISSAQQTSHWILHFVSVFNFWFWYFIFPVFPGCTPLKRLNIYIYSLYCMFITKCSNHKSWWWPNTFACYCSENGWICFSCSKLSHVKTRSLSR